MPSNLRELQTHSRDASTNDRTCTSRRLGVERRRCHGAERIAGVRRPDQIVPSQGVRRRQLAATGMNEREFSELTALLRLGPREIGSVLFVLVAATLALSALVTAFGGPRTLVPARGWNLWSARRRY